MTEDEYLHLVNEAERGQSETESKPKDATGNFFYVDSRSWARVCSLRDIAAAVAYLTIAQGSFKTTNVSKWSAKSIEKYTGLHSLRGTAAIRILVDSGLVELHEKTTRRAPLYRIPDFPAVERSRKRLIVGALQSVSRRLFTEIDEKGMISKPWKEEKLYRELVDKRLIERVSEKVGFELQYRLVPEPDPLPQLVWLPNAIVTGASDEIPPLRLLRARGDLSVLRLFVDLYRSQNLGADGGISRKVVYRSFSREKLTERGKMNVWGFREGASFCFPDHEAIAHFKSVAKRPGSDVSPVWDALSSLTDLGLLYVVPHLVENSSVDCEIIHPFGTNQDHEPMEVDLGTAARNCALTLVEGTYLSEKAEDFDDFLAPVYQAYSEVTMVGIYRLRYRPRTGLTAEWYSRLSGNFELWMRTYERVSGLQAEELTKAS